MAFKCWKCADIADKNCMPSPASAMLSKLLYLYYVGMAGAGQALMQALAYIASICMASRRQGHRWRWKWLLMMQ